MVLRLRVLASDPAAGGDPGPAADRAIELPDAVPEIRLGRRPGLEIELPFPAVAPLHARLVRDGDVWLIEEADGDSGTGTFVGEHRLQPGERRPVAPGQTLRLAHVAIVFDGAVVAERAAEGTATLARRLVSDLFRNTRQGQAPELVALAGPFPGAASGTCALPLAVLDRVYVVGRAETCDLVLPTEDVSREHARVVRRWEGVHIRDLGSKNGVTVGGQPVAGEHRLHDGDVIEIGSVRFRLDDPEDRYLRAQEPPVGPASEPAAPSSPPPMESAASRPRMSGIAVVVAVLVLLGVAGVAIALALG
jgi:pSer/pThr/pTyr-binding forkhead associated (FHA) protein